MAIASGAAIGSGATLVALRERRTGLAPCAFETAQLQTCAGQVTDARLVPVRADLAEFDCRNDRLAQLGLTLDGFEETVLQARERYGAARIGVFLGTSTSGIHSTELAYRRRDERTGALPADFHYRATHNTYSVAWFVQTYLGLRGPSLVVSTACSSSAKVFGTAARMIAADLCDAAVVGGVDSLCLTTLYGFGSLGLLSAGYCRPFDRERDGISIGEGAGFVLLEKPAANSAAQVALLGVGESSDAYHMSSPHPEGLGARNAIHDALNRAGLTPQDIDYINLHGTASQKNDEVEARIVATLFPEATRASSTKGWTGHALGAAGILEAVISLLALEHGFMPGTLNTRELDESCGPQIRLENGDGRVRNVMSNSFGFGGSNCVLLFGGARQ